MSKKIGVATIHHNTNPGSILQAYSQATAFQNNFINHDVEIIDFRFKSLQTSLLKSLIINLARLRFEYLKNRSLYKRFIRSNLPLSKDTLTSDDYSKAVQFVNDKYDVVVVGSDELWKTISPKFTRPFPNIYWLNPEINSKKIAFAVSANRCEFKDISSKDRDLGRSLLEDFDFIGVRDDHTKKIVRSLGVKDKKIWKVPDPTFMFDIDKNKDPNLRHKLEKLGITRNKPVLGVYTSLPINPKRIINDIIFESFKREGYTIVSLGSKSKYCDVDMIGKLNPFEWAEVYRYFDFCITSTFHGTLFCIKNQIPFLSMDTKDYYGRIKSKIRDLLEEMSLLDHYCYLPEVEDTDDFIARINHARDSFDKNKVERETKKMKDKYLKALKEVEKIIES